VLPLAPRLRPTSSRSPAEAAYYFLVPHLTTTAAVASPHKITSSRLGRCLLLRPPDCSLSSVQGIPLHYKWSTPVTTSAACSVPSSDLPADRGVTYERRRPLHIEGRHGRQHRTTREVGSVHVALRRIALIVCRRAKAIERALSKRADEGCTSAELAAVLQEYATPRLPGRDY
jgi:hypothetical protein